MRLLCLGACRALVVEARIRLCENRFLTVRRSIVVLWTKNRRGYGPHRRIRRPANQSPTDSQVSAIRLGTCFQGSTKVMGTWLSSIVDFLHAGKRDVLTAAREQLAIRRTTCVANAAELRCRCLPTGRKVLRTKNQPRGCPRMFTFECLNCCVSAACCAVADTAWGNPRTFGPFMACIVASLPGVFSCSDFPRSARPSCRHPLPP